MNANTGGRIQPTSTYSPFGVFENDDADENIASRSRDDALHPLLCDYYDAGVHEQRASIGGVSDSIVDATATYTIKARKKLCSNDDCSFSSHLWVQY